MDETAGRVLFIVPWGCQLDDHFDTSVDEERLVLCIKAYYVGKIPSESTWRNTQVQGQG